MVAKQYSKTSALSRPSAERHGKVLNTHSDEEENSSDGDDSVHSSDEEFIERDSEMDPDDEYAYSTTSETCSESATEADSESASESGSEVQSARDHLAPGSQSSEASDVNHNEERAELATALEGMSLASTQEPTGRGRGGAILTWLNEQAKLEVSKVGNLIADKFR